MGGGTRYHPGVSILYALPRILTDNPTWVYSLSLGVNSLLIGLTSVLLTLWLRIQSNSAVPSWLVAITVLFGGSTIYYASFSMSETAVIGYLSLYLLIAVTRQNHRDIGGWRTLACLGFLAGFGWIIHPRMLVLIPSLLLALLLTRDALLGRVKASLWSGLWSLVGLGLAAVAVAKLTGSLYNPGSNNYIATANRLQVGNFAELTLSLGGKLGYLQVCSFGLAAVGLTQLLRLSIRRRGGCRAELSTSLAVLVPVLALIFTSTGDQTSPKFALYGRYVEPLFLPPTIYGAYVLWQRTAGKTAPWTSLVTGLFSIGTLFFMRSRFVGSFQISNSPGLIWAGNWFGRTSYPVLISGVIIALTFLMVILRFHQRTYLVIALVYMISGTAIAMTTSYALDDFAEKQAGFRTLFGSGSTGDRVYIDRSAPANELPAIFGTQWAWSDRNVVLVNGLPPINVEAAPSDDLFVLAGPQLEPNLTLVASDKWTNYSVWRRPEPSARQLFHPRDLPAEGFDLAISNVPEVIPSDDFELEVMNIGSNHWFPRSGAFGSDGAVRFVVTKINRDGSQDVERIDLPGMISPGTGFRMKISVGDTSGLQELTVEGVHEGVRWFRDLGLRGVAIDAP